MYFRQAESPNSPSKMYFADQWCGAERFESAQRTSSPRPNRPDRVCVCVCVCVWVWVWVWVCEGSMAISQFWPALCVLTFVVVATQLGTAAKAFEQRAPLYNETRQSVSSRSVVLVHLGVITPCPLSPLLQQQQRYLSSVFHSATRQRELNICCSGGSLGLSPSDPMPLQQ